jgi:hypothetical protein
MTFEQAIFIIPWITILVSTFILMLIKGSAHFEYLKTSYPEKYGRFSSILDYNYYFDGNGFHAFSLYFPGFDKEVIQGKTSEIHKLEKRIRLLSNLTIVSFLLLVLYILTLLAISIE